MKKCILALVLSLMPFGFASAQAPAAEEEAAPDIEITRFRIEQASVAGSEKPWLRLLVDFNSRPGWADGIVFYYDVLVQAGGDLRVLSGVARYGNVKRGRHAAVLYVSPSTAERYGLPVAAQIAVGYNDELGEVFTWSAPGQNFSEGWATQYRRYPNQLMPITLTPFVATEYGKYPDALVPR